MNELEVSSQELQRIGGILGEVASTMAQASRELGRARVFDLGSHTLASAAQNFHERWEHGVTELSKASDLMSEGISKTAKLYAAAERAHTGMYRPGGDR
ncbi:hypothetical protein IEU95_10240 [Hoyosella rhizosphaerae]|uniref:Uncharacterized protein n=1 Tax=Hoyosella rhizosphaerae TaxID=1755582 RepID=A0A916X9C4_9ACTN|nr:hypothetical protein [Hoyosella rhizosphaerae]MBN4927214.1 hypothetical protein [Hoyosella rhizosphaerae]GGC53092.1 hypothetical protein GCM10011410_01800 [Hoyosella rhizosphaerae]